MYWQKSSSPPTLYLLALLLCLPFELAQRAPLLTHTRARLIHPNASHTYIQASIYTLTHTCAYTLRHLSCLFSYLLRCINYFSWGFLGILGDSWGYVGLLKDSLRLFLIILTSFPSLSKLFETFNEFLDGSTEKCGRFIWRFAWFPEASQHFREFLRIIEYHPILMSFFYI